MIDHGERENDRGMSELSARFRKGDIKITATGEPALRVVAFVVTLASVIALAWAALSSGNA